ncbi:30S ribosomal protein S16 [Anatilimnocola floriformis]|uniref:30S ribosomal protein S16 n=1 Tax=Anatilimnocola floriformis TaxID=2948575 RepID=UPI0020C46761|nr:30S ribosomal protein S16 [Anatilimnocola floriformis]
MASLDVTGTSGNELGTGNEFQGVLAVAVKIRMKKLGRKHRPYFRIVAIDSRSPRDGKVLEELGSYDPMVKDTDARALLKGERINAWIAKGALPSDNVRVLIKKYGLNGSHLAQQQAALERLKVSRPTAPAPWAPPPKPPEPEAPAAEAPAEGEAAPAETAS